MSGVTMLKEHKKTMSVNPDKLAKVLQQLDQVILGKPQKVRLAVTCLLAGAHLLIEDF